MSRPAPLEQVKPSEQNPGLDPLVIEVGCGSGIFNRSELEEMLGEHRLTIRAVFDSIPNDVDAVLGEPSWTLTYLCQRT
jgi:hypothetical protein